MEILVKRPKVENCRKIVNRENVPMKKKGKTAENSKTQHSPPKSLRTKIIGNTNQNHKTILTGQNHNVQ